MIQAIIQLFQKKEKPQEVKQQTPEWYIIRNPKGDIVQLIRSRRANFAIATM